VVGHTTKQMKHGRSCDIQIWWPSVENVALGLRPRATFSASGSSYFSVTLTTMHHLYNDWWHQLKPTTSSSSFPWQPFTTTNTNPSKHWRHVTAIHCVFSNCSFRNSIDTLKTVLNMDAELMDWGRLFQWQWFEMFGNWWCTNF